MTKNSDQIAFWTLSLFAGMRRHEIERLHTHPSPWKVIDLKRGIIDLTDEPCARNRREITILPVLRAWLSWIKAFEVPFYPPNHWEKFRLVRASVLGHRYADKNETSEEKAAGW